MTNRDKIEIAGKGFNWLKESLILYGKGKLTGNQELCDHITGEVNLIESIVKAVIKED